MAETIAAIATPQAAGGIAVIRISGSTAIEVADCVFTAINGKKLSDKKGYTAAFGEIHDGDQALDSGVALVYRAPKSYTGEDVVEISCHGGIVVTREVLRAILGAGARIAEPGEFTKRAYMNGKMSLTQAEAVIDVINSHSKQALSAAQSQLDGALYRSIQHIKNELLNIAGHLAAWADYPEEDIPVLEEKTLLSSLKNARSEISQLLIGYDNCKLIKSGIDTVIVGKPNVGKSTLMNLFVGEQRSIVTNIAGTTRDVIEESVMVGDILLKLSDTAGIRDTVDAVEQFGVELAKKRLARAVLILAVFDSSTPLSDEDISLLESIPTDKACIAVINKTDLNQQLNIQPIEARCSDVVYISAQNEGGGTLDTLQTAITNVLKLTQIDTTAAMLANERQRDCAVLAERYIKEAICALEKGVTMDAVTITIEQAIDALMELTGERITVELVNQLFSHFCVGK